MLDEGESASEGSIDPLGLYATADQLAVKLVPGVRERQRRPRFLTLICASAAICQRIGRERIAGDGVSEPWQVFEWYVVEGLVRRFTDTSRLRNLPGREKVANAVLKDRVPVSARRYLKTPSVFGFHGVYRALTHTLQIERGGELDEHGHEILETWENEQGLRGFHSPQPGSGRAWSDKLRDAVEAGLEKGCTSRSPGWEGWDFIAQHLAHADPGPQEKALLARLLVGHDGGFRRAVFEGLVGVIREHGWEAAAATNERSFHEALGRVASRELGFLLDAIGAYESLARALTDAFDCCLCSLSEANRPCGALELSKLGAVAAGKASLPALWCRAQEALGRAGMTPRLVELSILTSPMGAAEWVETLMSFHNQVQRSKEPVKKAPWIFRHEDGRYVVRPQYKREGFEAKPGAYVHQYRTQPLRLFAADLGLVN